MSGRAKQGQPKAVRPKKTSRKNTPSTKKSRKVTAVTPPKRHKSSKGDKPRVVRFTASPPEYNAESKAMSRKLNREWEREELDPERTPSERRTGVVVPKFVPYSRYGRGPGRRVPYQAGNLKDHLDAEDLDQDLMAPPPTEHEAKDGFVRGVFEQVNDIVDGVVSVTTYAGPPGLLAQAVTFTATDIERPFEYNGEYWYGTAINRRMTNPSNQLTAISGDNLTWNSHVTQNSSDLTVPGYATFSELYSAYRPTAATIMIRPMGSDQDNEGIVYAARRPRMEEDFLNYFNSITYFTRCANLATSTLKGDNLRMFSVPSDYNDAGFRHPWDTNAADGVICLMRGLSANQTLSVRRTWTVIGLKKVNYFSSLTTEHRLNQRFYYENNGLVRSGMSKKLIGFHAAVRKEAAKLLGVTGGEELFMGEGEVRLLKAYDRLTGGGADVNSEALLDVKSEIELFNDRRVTLYSPGQAASHAMGKFVAAEGNKYSVADVHAALKEAYLRVANQALASGVEKMRGRPGVDPYHAVGGFLSSIASVINPDVVKAATDIVGSIPAVDNVTKPLNATLKAATGHGVGTIAKNLYERAKKDDL